MPSKFLYRESFSWHLMVRSIKGLISEVNNRWWKFLKQLPHLNLMAIPNIFVIIFSKFYLSSPGSFKKKRFPLLWSIGQPGLHVLMLVGPDLTPPLSLRVCKDLLALYKFYRKDGIISGSSIRTFSGYSLPLTIVESRPSYSRSPSSPVSFLDFLPDLLLVWWWS